MTHFDESMPEWRSNSCKEESGHIELKVHLGRFCCQDDNDINPNCGMMMHDDASCTMHDFAADLFLGQLVQQESGF